MKIIYIVLLCLIFSDFTSAQEIKLPDLQQVQVLQHLRNSIAIDLFYNKNGQLTFKVGNEISTEADSLKSMLLKPLSAFSNSTIDNGFIKIVLSADEAIKMYDVEVLFQELKRLDLRKIIFVATSKDDQKNDSWSKTGFMSYLLQFDRKEAEAFYKRRNLPTKKFERISTFIIEKRKKEAERLNPPSPQADPEIPPEPRVETARRTEKSLKRNYPKAKVINVEISSKKKIKVNGKKIKPNDLNDFLLKEFLNGPCIVLLKTERKVSYGKYLVGRSSVVIMVDEARNKYSLEKYNKNFESLDWRSKKVVSKEIPHLYLSEIVD
ncbi:MAG: hypothetical protein AB8H03_22285 [Saprospiraceae bacterium]